MAQGTRFEWIVAAAALSLGSSAAHAAKGDDKASTELKALSEKMINGFSSADTSAFKSTLADPIWGAWDLDLMGRPVAMKSNADAVKLMDEFAGALKAMGGSLKVNIEKNDCRASGDMGVCMIEATQTVTVPKMPPMSSSFRNTEVYQKGKTGWKIVHHHGSVARWPETPPKFAGFQARSAPYQAVPGMPPAMTMVPLFMNPVTMGSVALIKVGPEGMKQARHIHPASYWSYTIEGSITTTDANGKETEFGPGSVVYRPGGTPHTSSVKPNSIFFMVTDGPMDPIFVDDKGNPLPPPAKK